MLPTSNLGEIAVLKIELMANLKGYIVSYPRNQSSRYDAIIQIGDKLYKTQIKYLNRVAHKRNHCLELQLSNKSQKRKCYNDKEIDLLLVYVARIDKVLCFWPKQFHNKKTIWINLKNEDSPSYYQKYLW